MESQLVTKESSFDSKRHLVGAILGPVLFMGGFLIAKGMMVSGLDKRIASGYVPITKMIKAGIILDIIGVFVVSVPLVYFLVKALMGV